MGGRLRGRSRRVGERCSQLGDFDFQSIDPLGLLGDEHVGVEQLAARL
jgi:hypothetical protein